MCHRLGLKGFAGFSSVGLSGGMALFWHESLVVEVKALNERFIDVYVRLSVNEPQWRLTGVYSEPKVENRHRMWDLVGSLKQESNLPWGL